MKALFYFSHVPPGEQAELGTIVMDGGSLEVAQERALAELRETRSGEIEIYSTYICLPDEHLKCYVPANEDQKMALARAGRSDIIKRLRLLEEYHLPGLERELIVTLTEALSNALTQVEIEQRLVKHLKISLFKHGEVDPNYQY